MLINLDINKSILKNEKEFEVHYIPASCNNNGSANVKEQFEQYTITDDTKMLSNSIRGIPLIGEKFDLPMEYTGVCLQETQKSFGEDINVTLKASSAFKDIVYWNYDKLPNRGDTLHQVLQICNIAEELYQPVSIRNDEQQIKGKVEDN